MNLEDPLGLITKQQLQALCKSAGLPTPKAVKAFGQPSRFVWYGLKFGGGVPPHMLRVDLVPNTRGAVIDHTLAAYNTLRSNDAVPSRPDGQRVGDAVFGRAAALFRYAELSDGLRLASLNHDFWPTVAADLGRTMAALADNPVPSFGTRAAFGRFIPVRSTWREEWRAYVQGLVAAGRSLGLDHGPLTDRMVQAIEARLDALDDVDRFALVHGELRASSLEYRVVDGIPQRANLTGLDVAMQGDPLVEAGYLLTMPPSVCGPILAAFGADRVRSEWLEPSALARIEAYHLTLCLSRPAYIAIRGLVRSAMDGLNGLELSRHLSEQALEPDFARTRIEQALEHPHAVSPPDPGPKPHQARTTVRIALAPLRGDVGLPLQQAPALVAALASASLQVDVADVPTYADPLDGAARTLGGAIARVGLSLGTEPITDRDAWRAGLVGDVLAAAMASPGGVGTNALMLTWLGLRAVDQLGGTVSDSHLRGLEATVREVAIQDAMDPASNDVIAMQHAAGGRAALVWLASRFDDLDADAVSAIASRLDARIQALVDKHDPGPVPSQDFADDAILPRLIAPGATQEQSLTRPFAALVLRTLDGTQLPTGPESMHRLLGA